MHANRRRRIRMSLALTVSYLVLCLGGYTPAQDAAEVPLIDRPPFDRITLNQANQNAVIDIQLLDLPERQVPAPLPTTGSIKIRRLSNPTTLYEVSWSDIAKVELYEQLILQEARQLVADGKLDRAFQNLAFLHDNYSDLAGLKAITANYLYRDAVATFTAGSFDEALAVLGALYDAEPQRPGLARAIEGVTDRLIERRLAERDYAGARQLLESVSRRFDRLGLGNMESWRKKFSDGADRQLEQARRALEAGDYMAARRALVHATTIKPDSPGVAPLLAELRRRSPQVVVGVHQHAKAVGDQARLKWDQERVSRLVAPRFAEPISVGPEGTQYACRWAAVEADESGLQLRLTFEEAAWQAGISPGSVARQVLRMADPDRPEYRADFAAVFASAEIVDGATLVLRWRATHVKPLALLTFPVTQIAGSSGVAYQANADTESAQTVSYRLPGAPNTTPAIVEEAHADEDKLLAALVSGDLDVIDQLPPWKIAEAQSVAGVTVSPYRMPTVHVLLCNYSRPLMRRREFRRALCYGMDRPRMVTEVLAGKEQRLGNRAVSGPLLAGVRANDSIGYAYKQELQPLPYEPRLAVVLSNAARAALAKADLAAAGDAPEDDETTDPALPEPVPLILRHPTSPVARTMCALIKRQLTAVGIPIELVEEGTSDDSLWDLQYAELCMWEPLADARQLLGPDGLAGHCSPAMNLALRDLDRATNWSDVRLRLQRVHQVAFNELPVIPLWQTVNYFARRDGFEMGSDDPISLYQDVGQWHVTFGLAGKQP